MGNPLKGVPCSHTIVVYKIKRPPFLPLESNNFSQEYFVPPPPSNELPNDHEMGFALEFRGPPESTPFPRNIVSRNNRAPVREVASINAVDYSLVIAVGICTFGVVILFLAKQDDAARVLLLISMLFCFAEAIYIRHRLEPIC